MDDIVDIIEDVLIEEPDHLIIRKWLVKWKTPDANGDNHSWEPKEAIEHTFQFAEYESAKKAGTLPKHKTDKVRIKQCTTEQYQQSIKEQSLDDGTWGFYQTNDNKSSKKKVQNISDIDGDNTADEDYDFYQELKQTKTVQNESETAQIALAEPPKQSQTHKEKCEVSEELRKCDECGKICKSIPGVGTHKWHVHGIKGKSKSSFQRWQRLKKDSKIKSKPKQKRKYNKKVSSDKKQKKKVRTKRVKRFEDSESEDMSAKAPPKPPPPLPEEDMCLMDLVTLRQSKKGQKASTKTVSKKKKRKSKSRKKKKKRKAKKDEKTAEINALKRKIQLLESELKQKDSKPKKQSRFEDDISSVSSDEDIEMSHETESGKRYLKRDTHSPSPLDLLRKIEIDSSGSGSDENETEIIDGTIDSVGKDTSTSPLGLIPKHKPSANESGNDTPERIVRYSNKIPKRATKARAKEDMSVNVHPQRQQFIDRPTRDQNKGEKSDICYDFLNKGQCQRGSSCRWVHVQSESNTHMHSERQQFLSRNASSVDVCFDFGNKGQCQRGDACPWRHVARPKEHSYSFHNRGKRYYDRFGYKNVGSRDDSGHRKEYDRDERGRFNDRGNSYRGYRDQHRGNSSNDMYEHPRKKRKLNEFESTNNDGYGPKRVSKPKSSDILEANTEESNERSLIVRSIPPKYNRREFRIEIEDFYEVAIAKCDKLERDTKYKPFKICNRLELKTMKDRDKLLRLCKKQRLFLGNDMLSVTECVLV